MTFDKSVLTNYSLTHNSLCFTNGTPLAVTQCDDTIPSLDPFGCFTLSSMFHIPQFFMQLLSVEKFSNIGCNVLFSPTSCVV